MPTGSTGPRLWAGGRPGKGLQAEGTALVKPEWDRGLAVVPTRLQLSRRGSQ